MNALTLPMEAEYFRAILAGAKLEEYREFNPYWRRRIEGRTFDALVLTLGYPKASDVARRMVLPWRGYKIKRIQHAKFGTDAVEVFAIDVSAATRTVTIPAVEDHDGHAAIRVTLPWRCLHCHGPRGEPEPTTSYDGSRRLTCHGWTNPCGHVERYSDVRAALESAGSGGEATCR